MGVIKTLRFTARIKVWLRFFTRWPFAESGSGTFNDDIRKQILSSFEYFMCLDLKVQLEFCWLLLYNFWLLLFTFNLIFTWYLIIIINYFKSLLQSLIDLWTDLHTVFSTTNNTNSSSIKMQQKWNEKPEKNWNPTPRWLRFSTTGPPPVSSYLYWLYFLFHPQPSESISGRKTWTWVILIKYEINVVFDDSLIEVSEFNFSFCEFQQEVQDVPIDHKQCRASNDRREKSLTYLVWIILRRLEFPTDFPLPPPPSSPSLPPS